MFSHQKALAQELLMRFQHQPFTSNFVLNTLLRGLLIFMQWKKLSLTPQIHRNLKCTPHVYPERKAKRTPPPANDPQTFELQWCTPTCSGPWWQWGRRRVFPYSTTEWLSMVWGTHTRNGFMYIHGPKKTRG